MATQLGRFFSIEIIGSSPQIFWTSPYPRLPVPLPKWLIARNFLWSKTAWRMLIFPVFWQSRWTFQWLDRVGGWTNPSEKDANVKIGSFPPRFGVKIQNMWNHHLVYSSLWVMVFVLKFHVTVYETGVGMIMESNIYLYITLLSSTDLAAHVKRVIGWTNPNIWWNGWVFPLSPCRHVQLDPMDSRNEEVEDLCLERTWRLRLDRCIHPWIVVEEVSTLKNHCPASFFSTHLKHFARRV